MKWATRGIAVSGDDSGVQDGPRSRLAHTRVLLDVTGSPLLGWGILLAVHGVYAFVMKTPEEIVIERERREVSTSTGRA